MLNVCINGEGDIFEEIKKMRKHAQVTASIMDGVSSDIQDHFRGVYIASCIILKRIVLRLLLLQLNLKIK